MQIASLDRDAYDALAGITTGEQAQRLGAAAGRSLDVERFVAERDAHYLAHLDLVTARDDVVAVAREHRGRLALGLATGATRPTVEPTLGALGLADLFTTLVHLDDVENPKPAPDTYLLAAARLEVAPEHAVAYEDSDEGLASARAARMQAIDVRSVASAG